MIPEFYWSQEWSPQAHSSLREREAGEEGKEAPDTPCFPTFAYRAVILLFSSVPPALI